MRHAAVSLMGLLSGGCVAPPSPPAAREAPTLTLEPSHDSRALPVSRLRLGFGRNAVPPLGETWLFQGELSDYHVGRVRRRDLPGTLLERQRPALVWLEPDAAQIVVAPSTPLALGETYALAAPAFGRLADFGVASVAPPLLERVWPPHGADVGGFVALCGEDIGDPPSEIEIEPLGLSVELSAGLGSDGILADRCLSARFDAAALEAGPAVFPPLVGGIALDPEPLVSGTEPPLEGAECAGDEVPLGPGCARLADDRLTLRNAPVPLLWTLELGGARSAHILPAGAELVARGLEPGRRQTVRGAVITLGGEELEFELEVETPTAQPHLVLNEVLADAVGPEPADEWVELVNDGSLVVDLAGMTLEDSGGSIELPAARLEPGEFAVLAREDYRGSDGAEPAAGTLLVRVPVLAKNGLSNSGEALTLHDATGAVLSRFPALASRHAGVSLARRRPEASDTDPSSFATHADPGASPGAPNRTLDD